jgi:hypothetical protein
MRKKKSRSNKHKRLIKADSAEQIEIGSDMIASWSDELLDSNLLASWFGYLGNLSTIHALDEVKQDDVEPSIDTNLLLKVISFWTREETTKKHLDIIASLRRRELKLGNNKNLIEQIIGQKLLTMIGDGDFDAAKSLVLTHQLLLHYALWSKERVCLISEYLIEVSRLASMPCLRSKETSKILDDMQFYARSKTNVTNWMLLAGDLGEDRNFCLDAAHFKINILYQSERGDKTNITLHLNLTIKLKTLIMLVFSRLQINPTNFEIFHIDSFDHSSKLMLEHSGEKTLKFLDIKDSEIYIITAHQSNTHDILLPTAITNQTKSATPAKRKPKKKRKQIPSNSSSCSILRLEEDDIEASSMEKCRPILKDIMNQDIQKIFAVPVDPVALNIPIYFDIIEEPMDLGTIDSQLESGDLDSPEEFIRLVRLVFENAIKFNTNPDSYVHVMARSLLTLFNSKIRNVETVLGHTENRKLSKAELAEVRRKEMEAKKKSKRKGFDGQPKYNCVDESDRVKHSKQLTLIFEEASVIFHDRRQRLNDLAVHQKTSQ